MLTFDDVISTPISIIKFMYDKSKEIDKTIAEQDAYIKQHAVAGDKGDKGDKGDPGSTPAMSFPTSTNTVNISSASGEQIFTDLAFKTTGFKFEDDPISRGVYFLQYEENDLLTILTSPNITIDIDGFTTYTVVSGDMSVLYDNNSKSEIMPILNTSTAANNHLCKLSNFTGSFSGKNINTMCIQLVVLATTV